MASPLEIFIKVSAKETFRLEVDSDDSIGNLKNRIEDKIGFPVLTQRISYRGEVLNDDRTVRDYNIKNDATLNLILPGKLKYPVEITILTADRRRVTLAVERHRFHFRG